MGGDMGKFPWGEVIDRFEYDFDGKKMEVTKFHPRKCEPGELEVSYHCEELRRSCNSIDELLIHWLAYKHLGNNESSLAHGICRALQIGAE